MSLQPWLDPSRAALVIIDVQNDFCHENGHAVRRAVDVQVLQAIVGPIGRAAEAARRKGVPVIFIRTEHPPGTDSSAWLNRAPWAATGTACLPGTWGCDFYCLQPEAGDVVITKHRYSAFAGTSLELVLRSRGRDGLLFCGVSTNVCVDTSARDGLMREFHVALLRDGCASTSLEQHAASLRNMEAYFGPVIDSEQLLKTWV